MTQEERRDRLVKLTNEQVMRLIEATKNIDERTRLKQWLFSYLYDDAPTTDDVAVPKHFVTPDILVEVEVQKEKEKEDDK